MWKTCNLTRKKNPFFLSVPEKLKSVPRKIEVGELQKEGVPLYPPTCSLMSHELDSMPVLFLQMVFSLIALAAFAYSVCIGVYDDHDICEAMPRVLLSRSRSRSRSRGAEPRVRMQMQMRAPTAP